jgi:predicted RNase H-like nuclease (RuvC/YqgF family)
MGARRPSTTSTPTNERPSTASSRRESDLAAALAKEHELRQKAEGQANQMSVEIEELSVTLFQQANDMVAEERRARAKLEERVEILEKRDTEKRKRLERLEGALRRIERVRGMLSP